MSQLLSSRQLEPGAARQEGQQPIAPAGPSLAAGQRGRKKKTFKLLSFPMGEATGGGTGSPWQLMQADLMLHPGKSWLPEATSLIRSL